MRFSHVRYMCFPSVVCVGKETEIAVFPMDTSRVFRSEWEYELSIVGMQDDMVDYLVPIPKEHVFEVKNGCLVFRHVFEREQEYSVRFNRKGEPEMRISLYAVEEDLYGLRPLKGDLHSHTYYSDGQDGITVTAADFREEGFDFAAVTDHNRMYTSELVQETCEGFRTDLNIIRGEEVHTPGSHLHIVNAGGTVSVAHKYISDPEGYKKAIDDAEGKFAHVPEKYRRRVAMAYWACEEIRKGGGIAIFAHPFWVPNGYNVSDEFWQILFDEKMFDAYEIMGGIEWWSNNLQLALWQMQTKRGNELPVVGSTDSHNHDFKNTVFGRRFTIAFAQENSTQAILKAVKNGMCVAGELPMKDDNEVRFYGSLRLVLFSHFLYKTYFTQTWQRCAAEGSLMRRYACGEDDVAAVLDALADSVPNFYRKFYGLDPLPVVSEARLSFLDRCLEKQRTLGPETKGSVIYRNSKNARRE